MTEARRVRRRRPQAMIDPGASGTRWYDADAEAREAAARMYLRVMRPGGAEFADLPPQTKGAYVRAVEAVRACWPSLERAVQLLMDEDDAVDGIDRDKPWSSWRRQSDTLAEARRSVAGALAALRACERRSSRRYRRQLEPVA